MTQDDRIAALEGRLQALIDRIDGAIVQARQNVIADLGFMEKEVADLCRDILATKNDGSRVLEVRMAEMIARLDELAAEIHDYQERTET